MTVDLAKLKAALGHIPGIDDLTETIIGGRRVYGFNGLIAAVDMSADHGAVEKAIRTASALRTAAPVPDSAPVQIATPLPATPATGKPMSNPAPGSFAASLRAMMDEARAGVQQARTDGLAKVGDAVKKLNDAKVATAHVASTMAKTIEDEAATVLSELGQVSNDLGGS